MECFFGLLFYIEKHEDVFRHSLLQYWYDVGSEFDDVGTNFDELGRKHNPEVIKYKPL